MILNHVADIYAGFPKIRDVLLVEEKTAKREQKSEKSNGRQIDS